MASVVAIEPAASIGHFYLVDRLIVLCTAPSMASAFLYYTTTYIPKERALASSALAAALGSESGLHTPNGKSVGQMAERSQSLFKYGLPFN